MKSLSTLLNIKFQLVIVLLCSGYFSFGKTMEPNISRTIIKNFIPKKSTQTLNSISLNYTSSNAKQLDQSTKIDNPIAALLFGKSDLFPFAPIPIDSTCTSTVADTFSINSIVDATSYDWIVPTGATFTQPLGDTLIVVDWTSATPGIDSIGVAAINICGPGDTLFFPLRILICNQPPDAVVDNYILTEDTTGAFLTVQLNDSDPNGDPLVTTILSPSTSGGTASVVNNDSLNYAPPANFYGLDTIVYQICDNAAIVECDVDTVFITINPVNDKPIAGDDLATTNEDTDAIILVISNDDDPNDPLGNIDNASIAILTPPSNGTTSINTATGEITYSPNLNFNGNDTLYYSICDDGNPLPAKCDTAQVIITVDPINDILIATNDTTITGEEQLVTYNVVANDSDANDLAGGINVSSINITIAPINGMATVNTGTGEINYTPAAGFHGLDSLTYEICDTGNPLPALCTTATFYITVPTEDCTNGIDDDGDGLIDCLDPDCMIAAPGGIAGNTTVCGNAIGENYNITAVAGATSYTWTVPIDATITAGQGTNNITITWGETDGDICVTATDGACTSTSSCLTIDTKILAPMGNISKN